MWRKYSRYCRATGAGLAAGIAIGIAMGVAMHNLGVGLAIGVAIGVAFEAGKRKKPPKRMRKDDKAA